MRFDIRDISVVFQLLAHRFRSLLLEFIPSQTGNTGKVLTTDGSVTSWTNSISAEVQIRRGTDAERQVVTFANGVLVRTTDTNHIWVGDGATLGGIPATPQGFDYLDTDVDFPRVQISSPDGHSNIKLGNDTYTFEVNVGSEQLSWQEGGAFGINSAEFNVFVSSGQSININNDVTSISRGGGDSEISMSDGSEGGININSAFHIGLNANDTITVYSLSGVNITALDGEAALVIDETNGFDMQTNGSRKVSVNGYQSYTTETCGLWLGPDVAIYRSAANVLSTTDSLTVGGILVNSVDSRNGAGAVSITSSITELTTTGSSQALTLANGTPGQRKTIIHGVDGGSAILTPTTKTGYSTITFTNAGDSVDLVYLATRGWMIAGSNGVVIAP